MADDLVRPTGPTKASKNDAGGGNIRPEPVLGIVKNNADAIRAGRIQVYIQDLNGNDPDDSKNWITVRFLSPFYGRTYGSAPATGYGNYPDNPVSYGIWNSPPDVGTKVVCIFVNGDMNYGYYIGCEPEPEALTMVPAIGSVTTKVVMNEGESASLAGATQLPVTNLNTANKSLNNNSDFLAGTKPVHSYVAATLSQQGLIRDTIRGTITTNAQRETPSRVGWGVSTPGRPIYKGGATDETIIDTADNAALAGTTQIVSRRAGHSFVMDDGDVFGKDQLIRMRTALGHQILMSDNGQCLFIIHANGQSWIELGKEGTIDMYSTNSVNIRTQGDLNLHADNNININAEKNINIAAKENININSEKETSLRVGTNYKQQTLQDHSVLVGGKMSQHSSGDASYLSTSATYINGSKVNLNTGQTSLTPQEVKPIPLLAQTDTLFDAEKGYAPAPGKLLTIVSRAPAHQPWAMANKGVDVKIDTSASAALAPAPSGPLADANSAAPPTPSDPVTVPTNATVPVTGAASAALDSNTTASMVGAAAMQASATAASAVASGTAIVDSIPKVGQLAQTAQGLVSGDILKPGSQNLINGLVAQGATVSGAMTNNLFTGQPGAENLTSFVNNTTAQVKSQVAAFTNAQAQLTNVGAISGKESPGAMAGVVLAGAQQGIKATTDFIKNASGAAAGLTGGAQDALGKLGSIAGDAKAAVGQLGSKLDAVGQSISSGNFAGKLASSVTGGLGSIAGSLTSIQKGAIGSIEGLLDAAKGVAGSAFKAVTDGYKNFKANVPQDLNAIAKNDTAATEAATVDPYEGLTAEQIDKLGGADPTDPFIRTRLGIPPLKAPGATALAGGGALGSLKGSLGALGGSLGSSLGAINTGVNQLNAAAGDAAGALVGVTGVTSLTNSITNSATQLKSAAASLKATTSGLQGLPGGINTLASVVNNTVATPIPGTQGLGDAINTNATALINNVNSSIVATAGSISSVTDVAKSINGVASAIGGPLAGVSGTVGALTGKLGGALGSLDALKSKALGALNAGKTELSSLTSLMPPDAAAKLNSAINAISSGGPVQINLPTVAEDTNNRSEVTSQLKTIISNPKIPPPNYGSSEEQIKASNDKLLEDLKKIRERGKRSDAQFEVTKAAKQDWLDAINNLPEGDPQIAELKDKFKEEYAKFVKIVSET